VVGAAWLTAAPEACSFAGRSARAGRPAPGGRRSALARELGSDAGQRSASGLSCWMRSSVMGLAPRPPGAPPSIPRSEASLSSRTASARDSGIALGMVLLSPWTFGRAPGPLAPGSLELDALKAG